jgi:lipid-binding SYLF domain-containing protein
MRPVRSLAFVSLVSALAVLAASCASPRGATIEDKRSFVRKMRDRTLEQLYEASPEMRAKIAQAAGYAVFSNINFHLLAVSGGDGYGIAVDQRSGKETFMRVAAVGGGPGIAMRDFRTVFVFRDGEALDRFVESGWHFVAETGASAVSSDRGGSATALAHVSAGGDQAATMGAEATGAADAATGEGVEVYQITQAGLALHAAMLGTRYAKDSELN